MRQLRKHGIQRGAVGLVLFGVVLTGCTELNVLNPNEPDRTIAFDDPAGLINLITGSQWPIMFGEMYSSTSSARSYQNYSDVLSTVHPNNGALDFATEPRQAMQNSTGTRTEGNLNFMWGRMNEAISNSVDALNAIRNDGASIIDPDTGEDRTAEIESLAEFFMGWAYLEMGSKFNKAFIVDETIDAGAVSGQGDDGFSPYPDLLAWGLQKMDSAISLFESNAFTVDAVELFNRPGSLTNSELAQLARSIKARYLITFARSPQERATTPWGQVISSLDNGWQGDFTFTANPDFRNRYIFFLQQTNQTTIRWHLDTRFVGTTDVSGAYQDWVALPVESRNRIRIVSPDRRVQGPGGAEDNGTYHLFEDCADRCFPAARGLHNASFYRWYRARNLEGTEDTDGISHVFRSGEQQLYRAEALINSGQAQAGVDIINSLRAIGELPPITTAGVPASADCVPRKQNGDCEDLTGALAYERFMEIVGIHNAGVYTDSRGFRLVEGTPIHFPVPARELEIINATLYTTGGVGLSDAAPANPDFR